MKDARPYWAKVALVFGTDAGMREHAFTICYIARGHVEAVRAAMRYGEGRCIAFNGDEWKNPVVGSVHVGPFLPSYMGAAGEYQEPRGAEFFEWKMDFPGTWAEHVEALRKRL